MHMHKYIWFKRRLMSLSLTCSQWNNGARWAGALRVLAYIVQALQHPTNGAISAANQNLVVGYLPEYIQTNDRIKDKWANHKHGYRLNVPRQRTAIIQIEYLVGIQQFPEAGDQLQSLATTGLNIDKDQQWSHIRGHHAGLDVRQEQNQQFLVLDNGLAEIVEGANLQAIHPIS